jgi:hypothetical protein
LKGEPAKVGLIINEQKTKNIRDVGPSEAIGNKYFKVVKKFVYLECLMKPTKDLSLWKYNEESRLQIGASSDCASICGRATFHARQNQPFTRP